MWIYQKEQDVFSHASDGQLVQHVIAGRERAFAVLVSRYGSFLFQHILWRVKDYDTSCDVLQQVWLQLYLSLPSLDQQRSLRPWLVQVMRSKVCDEMRRQRCRRLPHYATFDEDEPWLLLPDPALPPDEQLEQQEQQHLIQEAIALLPQRYQHVVVLRYLTHLPFSAIGRLIGMPESTAKTQFQRAKPLLRATLHDTEGRSSNGDTPSSRGGMRL